jgi:two-component system NtrC family sensor kinase
MRGHRLSELKRQVCESLAGDADDHERELMRMLWGLAALAALVFALWRLARGEWSMAALDFAIAVVVLIFRRWASRAPTLGPVTLATAVFSAFLSVLVARLGIENGIYWSYALLPAVFLIVPPTIGWVVWAAGMLLCVSTLPSTAAALVFIGSHGLIAGYCSLFAAQMKGQRARLMERTREAERGARIQATLYAIAELSNRELTREEMLRRLHAEIAGLIYAENLYIALYDPLAERVEFVYFADVNDCRAALGLGAQCPLVDLEHGLSWHVLTSGRALRGSLRDIEQQLRGQAPLKVRGTAPVEWLGVPMVSEGQVRGLLAVQTYTTGVHFNAADEALLGYVGKHVLQALERSRVLSLLAGLYDSIPGLLLVLDIELRLVRVNREALQLLGYDRADLHRRGIAAVFPEAKARLAAFFGASQCASLREEVELLRMDGESLPVLLSVSAERDEEGRLRHLLLVGQDLRDRKRLEVELRHSQKLESLGQMAAGIAHEINTPMQFIGDNLGFVEQASQDLVALAEGRGADGLDLDYLRRRVPRAIGRAREGVERVSRIVSAMRQFAHPGASREPADLNALVQNAVTVATHSFKYTADLELDLGELPAVPVVRGDLGQVLLNLIANAAHAMEEQYAAAGGRGHLRIATRRIEGRDLAEIRVQDDGTGIPEAVKSRLFEPFFTTKPVGKGTGQGLALTRAIVVDRHGGELWVEDVQPHGTCFVIRLPLFPAESAGA